MARSSSSSSLFRRVTQVLLMLTIVLMPQLFQLVATQEVSDGTCPTFEVITNFDPQKYLGRWYEYSNYDIFFQANGTCDTAQYTDVTEEGGPVTIGVYNRAVDIGTKEYGGAKGTAVLGEPDNATKPGKLIVNFYDPPSKMVSNTTNYNILDTDYDSYTIVYFCRQVNVTTKSEYLWILTRERIPAQALVDQATDTIRKQGIDTTRLRKTVQTDCPDPDSSSVGSSANAMTTAQLSSYFAIASSVMMMMMSVQLV